MRRYMICCPHGHFTSATICFVEHIVTSHWRFTSVVSVQHLAVSFHDSSTLLHQIFSCSGLTARPQDCCCQSGFGNAFFLVRSRVTDHTSAVNREAFRALVGDSGPGLVCFIQPVAHRLRAFSVASRVVNTTNYCS